MEPNEIEIDDELQNEQTAVRKQIHCALREATNCGYQCETEDQIKKHVETKHRTKSHLPCTVCNLYFRDLDDLAQHMTMTHKNQESTIKCNQCEKPLKNKQDLKEHITTVHWSYKPCTNYKTDSCSATPCRFNHIKLQINQEICYNCGKLYSSKSDIINHIKTHHGNTMCHKFMQNKCDRSGEECIFNHNTIAQPPKQLDFQTHNINPLHSPGPGMQNMSEHIQNQWQTKSPQIKDSLQMNFIQMIPQLVAQILTALTVEMNK